MNARVFLFFLVFLPLRGDISALHPRIYVRHDSARVGKGIAVSQFRARLRDPAYARWRGAAPPAAAVMEHAARYLEDGNAGDLAAVSDFLSKRTFSYEKNDVGGFLAAAEMATAFDWVYDGLTSAERASAMANIITTATSSERFLRTGGADINHNYTYMALSGVAVCGLVLHGEAEPYGTKARDYLELARKFLEERGRVLDTWHAREGAWAEGSHYTFHETLRNLVLALHAYRSASDRDYFAEIRARHGDFIRKAGRFLIGCTRPDMTFERTGDSLASRVIAWPTVPVTVEMLAAGVEDSDDAARLRSFDRALLEAYAGKALYAGLQWGMRIFWNPRASVTPSYKTLPLFDRMGAGTYEQFVFRNGFDQGSTQVTIVAGDHYTDHQHFDKGQFLIYHRGGLAIDSGAYDRMYKPDAHSNEYAPRTLAHNCLLVYDPGEAMPKGYGNDGGQVVIRGKQHHPDWQTYVAHREAEGLHTGEVIAYDTREREYAYLRVDLRRAYGAKVTRYERQFAYLPEADWLVVFDRVTSSAEGFLKRWLLHMQDAPWVEGRQPAAGVQIFHDARAVLVRREGVLELGGPPVRYDGALLVETLLPEHPAITTVGGAGYEYFNAFTGKNYPVSNPAVAADVREPGKWRMEVSPAEPAASDRFLHSIQIGDGGMRPRAARLVRDADGLAVGAHLVAPDRNQVVMFGGHLPLRYEIETSAPAKHLIAELPPLADVVIEAGGRTLAHAKVNAQGVLRFDDAQAGKHAITVRRR